MPTVKKGEKSNKFFLNLEKRGGIQDQIRKLVGNGENISAENESEQRLNYVIKPCLKKCGEIFS